VAAVHQVRAEPAEQSIVAVVAVHRIIAAVAGIDGRGLHEQVSAEADRVEAACRDAGAAELLRATTDEERQNLWRVRREISPSLLRIASRKINHDIVVPKGRIPELFELVAALKVRFDMPIPAFGHVGDGNIHVNIMVDRNDPETNARVKATEQQLFEGVVALEGSVTGEHGIGFSKARYLPLEIPPETIAVMKAVKQAFDPRGLLNPGKIFLA
jgi:glycolate oxidase